MNKITKKYRDDGTLLSSHCECGSFWKIYQNENHHKDCAHLQGKPTMNLRDWFKTRQESKHTKNKPNGCPFLI